MAGREVTTWTIGLVWLAGVLGGFWAWERFDRTAGAIGEGAAPVSAPTGEWRLTVFAHPRCPCTRATLREVAEIASAAPELSLRVVFVRPPGAPDGWERGETWDLAARLPRAEVTGDTTGAEARRFGAETSGQAVLTDPNGRVVFRGGLTAARGRTDPGAGRRAVETWIGGGEGAPTAPVYGCPLFDLDE